MRIKREELITQLEMVKAGVSPREFIEQSSCYVFQDKMVMTFNDEVACRMNCSLHTTGAVQASSLGDILGKVDDEFLDVQENDKGELEFRSKRKAFGIVKDAEVFLPIDRVEIPKKWIKLPPEFTEGCGLVQHCVSTDENKFVLTCIHIHPDYIEACDNMQAMRVKVNTGLSKPTLVRGTSLVHVTSLGMDHISLTDSWLHFKNQHGLIFSCRRYAEDYPPLEDILAVKGHQITIPKGLKEASERAAVFAADQSGGEPQVTISIRGGKLLVKGEGMTGWYKEIKKLAYDGPDMEFTIAPELLKQIAEKYSEASITETKLKIRGGAWKYVTVLGHGLEAKKEKKTEKEEDSSEE